MNLNVTVNESCPCPGPGPTPEAGSFSVTAHYIGMADAGHTYGPFASRAAAEACALALAGRDNVRSVSITPEPEV